MARLAWGFATDPGRIRPENEDNVLADQRVFVVADGMGGHRAGEVAAAITIDLLRSRLSAPGATLDDVVASIADANTEIFRAANENPDQQGMGTTVTGLVLIDEPSVAEATAPTADGEATTGERTSGDGDADEPLAEAAALAAVPSWALVNVGDSRTYLLRHGRLRRVTLDHSYVQELVTTGHITDEEARTHPRRNIVTRALGIDPSVRVDAWRLPLVRGDRFLVCSDGLSDEIADDEITEVLATITDPQGAADELVQRANDHGGRDNVTVVVVDVLEGADPPHPDEELDLEPAWQDSVHAGTWSVDDPDGATEFDDLAALVSGDDDATTAAPAAPDAEETGASEPAVAPRPRRRRRVTGFLGGLTLVAVLLLAFVIAAAWARRGYFVAFDEDDQVFIYRGQTNGFLWFHPTVEAATGLDRDELDEASIARVERAQRFSSRASVEDFVADQLDTTTTTSTTSTTTTSTTSTTTSTTSTTSTTVARTTTTASG